jgi:hypothetical protein
MQSTDVSGEIEKICENVLRKELNSIDCKHRILEMVIDNLRELDLIPNKVTDEVTWNGTEYYNLNSVFSAWCSHMAEEYNKAPETIKSMVKEIVK